MKIYDIEGLSCASCASSAQNVLGRMEGVKEVRVNYATKTAAVDTTISTLTIDVLNNKLERLGFVLHPKNKDSHTQRRVREQEALSTLKKELLIGAVFAFPLFIIAMFVPTIPYSNYIMFALTLPILGWTGQRFFISAAKQASILKVNMDSLVALGTGTAFLFSTFNTFFPQVLESNGMVPHVYFEAVGVLLVFVLLGKYLETKASQQTSSAIEELLAMQATTVQLLENGVEKQLPIEVIQAGDVLKIRPGDIIPLDGVLVEGTASVDESMLTGESFLVTKKQGDKVFGGTILQQGSFTMEVKRIGEDTVLAQIIALVEEAQNTKVPIQKLVDKIAAVFVPVVMLIALFTFLIWWANGMWVEGLVNAVAVLVVACPCALGLATPTAITVGIGAAARKGILMQNVAAIEAAKDIDSIVLDKTGTITEGKPQVTTVAWKSGLSNQEFLEAVIWGLENESEHPIAKALVAHYQEQGKRHSFVIQNFENHSGFGLSATVGDDLYWLGNQALLKLQNITIDKELEGVAKACLSAAKTLVFFVKGQEVLSVIGLSDVVKAHAKEAIKTLQQQGKTIYMLTGDNEGTAAHVAQEVGITEYQSNVLPQDKIAFVKKLQASQKGVMMVGDGINDAPALAQANIGVAMNNGTSVAISSADIVLRQNDLRQLEIILSTSKQMLQIIRQNLFWAFIYNILLIPIAAGVLYAWGILLNPMVAGGAMALSSVFVVANSLRLKKIG
ncbi:cation-translocating P-type ATPase [Aureispira sp. CCB-QB1]|uniref:heavy metal translocating P-type ATPase n=1 Tax=Aureispira sp. CCB-QB1 TaxID=1313421 RepID=UPI0006988C50|nr:heavy metal translocating P-type ATPase [Aureispira sp. CCB-QB1]